MKRSTDSTPENAPATALNDKALGRLYTLKGSVQVERNRYFLFGIAMAGAVVALSIAIAVLTPLKTVTPYMIQVDSIGRTQAVPAAVTEFKPSEAQLRYHLAEWVYQIMTVRPGITTVNLTKAFDKVQMAAVEQFRSHIASYRPVERSIETPENTADVAIKSVNFLPEKNALILFTVTETDKMGGKKTIDYSITINYDTYTPKTEEQILKNPIGLVIKNFSLSREISK
jgi:type IV secretory pathway component VirB8